MGLRAKIQVLVFLSVVVGIVLLSNITWERSYSPENNHLDESKKSICFLLGTDNPGHRYFELAEQHFLYDTQERSDVLIKSCRSIEDVIRFLNDDNSNYPWSTIEVVLHGNPWNGLSMPITNDGHRATPKRMIQELMLQKLPKLVASGVDTSTQINFWGCGIGKNPFIQIALDSFFSLPCGGQPKIYISPHFVVFKEVENSNQVKRVKASYWPYIFKRGYRPSNSLIAQELRLQHPQIELEWQNIIEANDQDLKEGVFQNSFHIPVSWTVIYPSKDSRPQLKTMNQKMEWIKNQDELMDQINELNIPIEKFHWTVNRIIHTDENGQKVPAIKAIGMATILCVMNEV